MVVRLGVLHLSKLAMSWKDNSGSLWQIVERTKEHEAGKRRKAPSKVRKTPPPDATQCWLRRAKHPRTPWRRTHSSSALHRRGSHWIRFRPIHWQRLVQSLFQNNCLGLKTENRVKTLIQKCVNFWVLGCPGWLIIDNTKFSFFYLYHSYNFYGSQMLNNELSLIIYFLIIF